VALSLSVMPLKPIKLICTFLIKKPFLENSYNIIDGLVPIMRVTDQVGKMIFKFKKSDF